MANYQVHASQLTEGEIAIIEGKVAWSRIAKVLEGQALQDENARRTSAGLNPREDPLVYLTLKEARVVPISQEAQAQPRLLDIFLQERFYTTKKDNTPHYEATSVFKGSARRVLPGVYVKESDGNYKQTHLTGELAPDLKVRVVLRVFKPRNYANRGIAFDQVLVEEPLRLYQSEAAAKLASLGINLNPTTEPAPNPSTIQESATPAPEAPQAPTVATGFDNQAPQTMPYQQPAAEQAPVQPVQAPVQPVQPTANPTNPVPQNATPWADPSAQVPPQADQNGSPIYYDPTAPF